MKTSGNTVLITGGGSGIGLALAGAFLHAGNEVIICGRTQATLDKAMHRLPALQSFTCDIALEEDRQTLFNCVKEHFPRLNMLVNNAAVAETTDLTHAGAAHLVAAELAVDLEAPILLTMQFLPILLKQPKAAVINITSALSDKASPRYPAYSAAKAGLHSFSLSLRHQLKETRVSVFEVLPPAVDTQLNKDEGPKISPAQVAATVLGGIQLDTAEIRFEETKKQSAMARLLPGWFSPC